MSPLRWTLVALLVASTALFAVGAIAERSSTDTHTEPAAAHAAETGGEKRRARGRPRPRAARPRRPRPAKRATPNPRREHAERERLLGVDVESTPLIVLAVLAGLALAALVASRFGSACTRRAARRRR